ncbi:glycoside hydrolase/phage tail family protein [Cognatishimia sp. F0-27]|uniref:baseplate multidomain protein megatron n=1 Tax=Cognatishimia sp. F0-27 TaxID=2816855 RepID=UPI001D0CBCDB|nr:glycoside hydrolase/phage tail family protein [Cognatishimia sp. F0-27]MCC1492719.1 glycoside hydrolase/phage tail family protein [Cognatishimia sp. F0-27]
MATLVLGAAGAALGGSIGGAFLGVSAATIGGFVGSTIGSAVDSWIVSSLAPTQRIEGPRLDTLRITSSTEGAVIPRVFGRMRLGGQVIWATDFREETKTTSQGGGGKGGGGGGKVKTTEYLYFASFAVAVCEGPITGLGRIWADGKLLDTSAITLRWYSGSEIQDPDPLIAAKMGPDSAPAYRGTAYVLFEDIPLKDHGNRLPQLSFEVTRALGGSAGAETLIRSVAILPGSGEFGLATTPVRSGTPGSEISVNVHARAGVADLNVALDGLAAALPNVEAVTLVIPWFGDDLRAGHWQIRPKVEATARTTTPLVWTVNGVALEDAAVVTLDGTGTPVFGGTPSDNAVVEAIRELKSRGYRVTLSPTLVMDIPESNALPDPYSDNAGSTGQEALPSRSRITGSPAPGFAGTVEKTAGAAAQVAAFFGTASSSDFSVSRETVSWTGGAEWGWRRMVLHYAHLAVAAGGVNTILLGGGLRGLTSLRSDTSTYPAVAELVSLAAAVRSVVGAGTAISYAADWREYGAHVPDDGSGDVYFPLDALWANADIDFVGIDYFPPLADWRDGTEHLDAQAGWSGIHDRDYFTANVLAGEHHAWRYASEDDRQAQIRMAITDPLSKPWVFRPKDLRSWWANPHFSRPGGTEATNPTAWIAGSKPIRFTAFGCPAVDRGANEPAALSDPSVPSAPLPYFSRGWRDDAIQRAWLEAVLAVWVDPAKAPAGMLDLANSAAWGWDARPWPHFPDLAHLWPDTDRWALGPWLTGRMGSSPLPALVTHLCERAGLPADRVDASGLTGAIEGMVINALESPRASISTLARYFGFDAVESEGLIKFVMRGRNPTVALHPDDLVTTDRGDVLELTRSQETELSQALKWQVVRADGDMDPAQVEARRVTVDSTRIALETFPLAVSLGGAERQCLRQLNEMWIERERAAFKLPPSRLALDPADVVALRHDERDLVLRLTSIADQGARGVEALRQDSRAYGGPPGASRAGTPATPTSYGTPIVVLMDLPQLTEDVPAHRPMVAAFAKPWPGQLAVMRSPSEDGFALLTTIDAPATLGVLAEPLPPGPTSRFDHANTLTVDLYSGSLTSVTDTALFAGANPLAIESSAGVWEIVQAGTVELIGPTRYRLTRLLRGQRGSVHAMGDPAPVGARVVVLDEAVVALPTSEAEIGSPFNWRIGPASLPVSDSAYVARNFTAEAVGLRPFSPGQIVQPWRTPRSPGDLTIRWTRRSRALSADSWVGLDVPMVEDSEAYEIDILDGSAVKRTLSAASPSAVYTAAQQTSDWGRLLDRGDTLTIRVAQISNLVGRGTPKTVTLHL